jgi:multicomponent Na+:H+ antiporter subunit G
VTIVAGVLLIAGAALTLVAAIGVYRFPDVLTRLHAATKAASVGIALVLLGVGAALEAFAFTALVALFGVLTAPVAAHALGRAVRPESAPPAVVRPASMPAAARILALAAVWVALWGDPSPANVLGGLAVGAVVAAATARPGADRIRLRPAAALRFTARLAVVLVRSTLSVAAAALGPARLVDPAVVRVPVGPGTVSALVAAANAVSVTPGTLTLAIETTPPALVVHLLRPDDPAVEAVATLHSLAADALPAAGPTRGGRP